MVVCTNTTTAVVLGSPSTCTGGTLYCESSLGASDPTCNYNLPSVIQDGNTTFRAFVFDSHDLGSASNYVSNTFTVNNVAPSVSGVILNGGSDISLSNPGGNTNVSVTATVTDNNSCEDVAAGNVTASIYHALASGGYSSCDDNGEDDTDSCYALEACTLDGGSCTGSSDATETYTCTVAVAYHADPTSGAGTSDSPWWDHEWYGTVEAEDDTGLSDDIEVGTPVEMEDYIALNVTSSINYGALLPDQDSEDISVYPETTVTAYGNVGLDSYLSGANMCDDWPTCLGNTISVGFQEHAFSTFIYGAGTDLAGTPTEYELNCTKSTSAGQGTKIIYWGIGIPNGTLSGVYQGSNTIDSVKGETSDW
jgi:hypothetical protein